MPSPSEAALARARELLRVDGDPRDPILLDRQLDLAIVLDSFAAAQVEAAVADLRAINTAGDEVINTQSADIRRLESQITRLESRLAAAEALRNAIEKYLSPAVGGSAGPATPHWLDMVNAIAAYDAAKEAKR